MSGMIRRDFLKSSLAFAGSTFAIGGTKSSGSIMGANDRIRVAVAGLGGRGGSHMSEFAKLKDVEVAYVIDPDSRVYDRAVKRVQSVGGNEPQTASDVRKVLDDKNVDAVSIATCNHWHSLITVWACQAGKDVYVEKPMSHNIFEGRKCVEAAKKYNRVVQHGTQQRSSESRARQMAAIHSGKYGKLLVSKGYCCKPRWAIGDKPISDPPAGFDFNLWLGPAPEQDFHANLHPYNWHWFWDFGNGDTGNQGVHEMDVARWAIKDGTLPTKVWSLGGRFTPDGPDNGQTPNMQVTVMEFGDTILLFETRGLVGKEKSPPRRVANVFYTTEGVIEEGKFTPHGGGETVKIEGEATVTDGGPFGSFINAVRSRKPEDINCDVEVAHYSSALCHLGNISYRLGEKAMFRKQPGVLGDNKQVVESFAMLKENLNMLDYNLDEEEYQLGRVLNFDPQTERFDDDEANALLTRAYRKPFAVPERV